MHAENGSVIDVIVQQALAEGKTAPVYHALTRPTIAEAEAVNRAIALAEIAPRTGLYRAFVFGGCAQSGAGGAQSRSSRFRRTCPQYLLLSIDELKRPGFEGAKYVFTPPLRERKIFRNCGMV